MFVLCEVRDGDWWKRGKQGQMRVFNRHEYEPIQLLRLLCNLELLAFLFYHAIHVSTCNDEEPLPIHPGHDGWNVGAHGGIPKSLML